MATFQTFPLGLVLQQKGSMAKTPGNHQCYSQLNATDVSPSVYWSSKTDFNSWQSRQTHVLMYELNNTCVTIIELIFSYFSAKINSGPPTFHSPNPWQITYPNVSFLISFTVPPKQWNFYVLTPPAVNTEIPTVTPLIQPLLSLLTIQSS